MTCCGPSKSNIDEKQLFKQLRENEEIISLKLDGNEFKFDPQESRDKIWTGN